MGDDYLQFSKHNPQFMSFTSNAFEIKLFVTVAAERQTADDCVNDSYYLTPYDNNKLKQTK